MLNVVICTMNAGLVGYDNPFPADSFKKYKINIYPKMCILMYFKIQSDQLRITRNALKSQIFDLFTKSSSGYKKTKTNKKRCYS